MTTKKLGGSAKESAALLLLGIGFFCLIVGLFFPLPGESLTSLSSLHGDPEYFHIEEYVGGDAYNYIIGASILGGHIAGAMTVKAVFSASGLMLLCAGGALLLVSRDERSRVKEPSECAAPSAVEVEVRSSVPQK